MREISKFEWEAIKKVVLDAAETIGARFRDHDRQLERLADEVRRQEAEIALIKAQENHRKSFAQKLREKGKT